MKHTIVQDTREQENKHDHVLTWFEENNYKVIRSKLYAGDYTYLDNQQIVVDTKKDLQEVVSNVTKDHERFTNELMRCQENGIQIYILVTDPKIKELREVNEWWNPRLKYSKKATRGTTLFKILYSIEKKYDTKFVFAPKEQVAPTIIKLLDGELK